MSVGAQVYKFSAVIPMDYMQAKEFSLLNADRDTLFTFTREGRSFKIVGNNRSNYLFDKRKLLIEKNETIAIYRKKKIVFPSSGLSIIEKKTKKGWTYLEGKNDILEINYEFNKTTKNYEINVLAKELNEVTAQLIAIGLGKFEKRVVMNYDDHDTWPYIIGILTGLSSL